MDNKEQEVKNKMNFEELDKKVRFRNKADLLDAVKNNGCEYISECFHKLYFDQKKTVQEVSKSFGLSKNSVFFWAKKWGFKLREKGGNVLNPKLSEPGAKEKILAMKGNHSIRDAAEIFGCSVQAVRNIWGPTQQKKRIIPQVAKKHSGEETEYQRVHFSTWETRGVSKETWEKNQRALELEAWKKHRNYIPSPLSESIARIGNYTGI